MHMKRILLVKTSSLGDVIHNLPVVNDILAHEPNAKIDWVVEEAFADIPRMHPNVQEVFTVAVRRWRKQLLRRQTWQEINQYKRLLSSKRYDLVIDTQGLVKSAIMACGAHGEKHGYDKHSIREPLASRFYNKTYSIDYQLHAVQRVRTLAAFILGYAVPTTAPDYGIQGLAKIEAPLIAQLKHPFMMALHATSRDAKLWPETQWVALGLALNEQGYNIALPWANQAEQARALRIATQLPNAIVLPKLRIAEMTSVIAKAHASIGVDTGLSHLSAALKIPTVAIYTDTNPKRTGVMAARNAQVVNLGGKNQNPTVPSVLAALKEIHT